MRGIHVQRVTWAVLFGCCVLLAACSGSATSPTVRGSQQPSAAASTAACASVRTTTAIDKVPAACAALWQPYHVTMVPPPDILQQEHVPAAPHVVNMTNGAVSQAEAQHWADANNWASGWYQWAAANDQPFLLPHIAGPALIGPPEEPALEQGAHLSVPACAIYPLSNRLFPILADGKAYFAHKNLPIDDSYVLVVNFTGPCSATATFPDGHIQVIQETSGPGTAFVPGTLRHDPMLGDLWVSDAGGSCSDPTGPPPEWCGR